MYRYVANIGYVYPLIPYNLLDISYNTRIILARGGMQNVKFFAHKTLYCQYRTYDKRISLYHHLYISTTNHNFDKQFFCLGRKFLIDPYRINQQLNI